MKILTIDIGNSHSHWGLFSENELLGKGSLSSRSERVDFSALFCERDPLPKPDAIIACSVVPRVSEALAGQAAAAGISCEFLTHERTGPLRIHYPNPPEVGPDRLANALGGLLYHSAPLLIIDMGTAVTLDAVTRTHGYEGGAIAPGFAFLSDYLVEKTALLPSIDLNRIHHQKGIGRSTTQAMEVGCAAGFTGMIRELVSTISEEIREIDGEDPALMVTGGSFSWVEKSWIGKIPYYPDLTLEGLLSQASNLVGTDIKVF